MCRIHFGRSRSPQVPEPGCPPTAARRGRAAYTAGNALRGRHVRRCTAGRGRRRSTAVPRRAMRERRAVCRSATRRRCATPPKTATPPPMTAGLARTLVALEHRMPSGDVDPQLRFGVVGAVARSGDRFDAPGPGVDPHQRIGHPDGGAAVGHRDGEEVRECAVQPAAGIGVDACAVGDRRGEERVEVLEHNGALKTDQRCRRSPHLPAR